jgi:HemX protein
MAIITDIAFYVGTVLFLAAALAAQRFVRSDKPAMLDIAERLLFMGMACLIVSFILRWAHWGRVPLTTMTDSLGLFAVLSGVVVTTVLRRREVRSLLYVYLPPLAAICLFAAATAHRNLHTEPKELSGILLIIHVGLALLAYALFFVASMTSFVYLLQSRRLKRRSAAAFAQGAPSLEELDRLLFRLVGYGYPLFVATLTLGLVWAWVDRDLLGHYWWLAPKVILSYVMAGFFAITFHMRRVGRLRGPKLATLVFLGFTVLILAYMVLSVMNLRWHYFWSAGA